MQSIWHFDSPLGRMWMSAEGPALTGLWFDDQARSVALAGEEHVVRWLPVFEETAHWLECYFGGQIPDFTPPLALHGTPFRQAVWEILREIPYGATMTYGGIAARLAQERAADGSATGKSVSAQAVGGAVGHNPIALIVPCHRVIGAGGKLTGYAAGLDRKTWLLQLERTVSPF